MTTENTIGGGTLTILPKNEPYKEQQNNSTFAVIKRDGSVFSYDCYPDFKYVSFDKVANKLNGSNPAKQIYSNGGAFAVLRSDGSVVTFGEKLSGGDGSFINLVSSTGVVDLSVVSQTSNVLNQLNGSIPVTTIYSSNDSFVALRNNGSLIT